MNTVISFFLRWVGEPIYAVIVVVPRCIIILASTRPKRYPPQLTLLLSSEAGHITIIEYTISARTKRSLRSIVGSQYFSML